MKEEGITELTVISTHTVSGYDYRQMSEDVSSCGTIFNRVRVTRPLVEMEQDFDLTARAVQSVYKDKVGDGCLILMARGADDPDTEETMQKLDEIDEDSLDSDPKEGTASIDVEFTYTDYSDIQDAIDYVSPREFENALDDVDDIKKINITLEFETEDEELKLTNATELDQVYDFDDLNVTYIDSIFDLVDETYLLGAAYNADDESYYNTTTLEMMIVINERGQNLAWTYKYKVCRDWEQIYISDWITEQSPSEIHVVYQSDTVLEPGNYQLLVYEPDNVTIIGFEVDVYAT